MRVKEYCARYLCAPLAEWLKQRQQIVFVLSKVPTNHWVELQNEAYPSGFLIKPKKDGHISSQLEKLLGAAQIGARGIHGAHLQGLPLLLLLLLRDVQAPLSRPQEYWKMCTRRRRPNQCPGRRST